MGHSNSNDELAAVERAAKIITARLGHGPAAARAIGSVISLILQGQPVDGILAALESSDRPALSTRVCSQCGETHDVPPSHLVPGRPFVCDHCLVAAAESQGVVS
jgi:hypothetical protein